MRDGAEGVERGRSRDPPNLVRLQSPIVICVIQPLPGHDKDGAKVDADWHQDTPKKATYKKWVKLLRDSTFFPAGQAVVANVPGAPDLAAFEDRAANARP